MEAGAQEWIAENSLIPLTYLKEDPVRIGEAVLIGDKSQERKKNKANQSKTFQFTPTFSTFNPSCKSPQKKISIQRLFRKTPRGLNVLKMAVKNFYNADFLQMSYKLTQIGVLYRSMPVLALMPR
jgi:hypothetical protein